MICEYYSKNKKNLFITSVLILFCGVLCFIFIDFPDKTHEVFCTMEAKLCPDGSYVGRTPPNCEFSRCPSENKNESYGFGNNQIEKSITNYLLSQKHFSWKTRDDSFNFCAIENLGLKDGLFPLYIWAYCGEYVFESGILKTLSGSSLPAKINYPNELSFYNLNKFSYETPGDGSRYTEDIMRIFPEDIQQKIFDFDTKNIIKRAENVALANIQSWELMKAAIDNCEVKKVFQTHSRNVTLELKNGNILVAVEPKIDDIIKMANSVIPRCGRIQIATE